MAGKHKHFAPKKGRLNLLIMKHRGKATNVSISHFVIMLAIIFAVAFVMVSVVIINRYYILYYDYQALARTHQASADELYRLRSLYSYQSSVASEYSKIMKAMNRSDPQSGLDVAIPPIGELAPVAGEEAADSEATNNSSINSLDDWAALFPDVPNPPEHILNIGDMHVSGRNFRFQLTNETGGATKVQGRMLLLFSVEDENGSVHLIPYPNFEININNPDFNEGPSYNINSSKQVAGRLSLPENGVVVGMMAVIKSSNGQVVLKKKIMPTEG